MIQLFLPLNYCKRVYKMSNFTDALSDGDTELAISLAKDEPRGFDPYNNAVAPQHVRRMFKEAQDRYYQSLEDEQS